MGRGAPADLWRPGRGGAHRPALARPAPAGRSLRAGGPAQGAGLILRDVRLWDSGALTRGDVTTAAGRIASIGPSPVAEGIDLGGRVLLPGLVNAHDHLDLSTFPALGRPPYASARAWAADIEGPRDGAAVTAALSVSPSDRLFLGGLRNLLAGATAVAHHGPYHRALARRDFPVRVLAKYQFAYAAGPAPALRRTYRTTDRRIPWMIHAGEGTDERSRGDVDALVEANVLRQNTVLVHAIALRPGDAERIAEARACVVWCPESDRRLYGRTADVAALRAAGVRVGLGSESPLAGTRDALSNLAAARGERVLTDGELVELATAGSAEVARLPGGRIAAGQPADLVAVDSMEAWLEGDRRTLALVVVAGRPLYGDPALLDALAVRWRPVTVDGAPRGMESELARRAASLVRGRDRAEWMRGLAFSASPLPPGSPP